MLFRFSFALVALGMACLTPLRAETVWWEAESANNTNMPKVAEDPATISGGQWLQGKVADGLFAQYTVTVKDGGKYDFQARRFWLHGAFRWHFDNDPWVTVDDPHQWILNDQPKAAKVGNATWSDLGYVSLTPGAHTLRIELVTATKYAFNTSFGFDCFVLTNDGFTPEGISHDGGPRQPRGVIDEAAYGKYLPHTMALLESSSPQHRTHLTILFYGQSIIANSNIDLELRTYLLSKYPNVVLTIEKRAIGGYEAPKLCRTAWQDLYPENPDLLVFHDYGGENGELEDIYRNIKANMTTEVLTWTHHIDNFGIGIDHQRDASCVVLRGLAAKYGWELADVRPQWKDYLLTTHVPISSLLVDQIHLNPKGSALLRDFLTPHFRDNPIASADWKNHIRTLPLNAPQKEVSFETAAWTPSAQGLQGAGTQPLKVKFTGNRVDLTPLAESTGSAKILLDGQTPSTLPDTLAASRSTIAPGAWWPVISCVGLGPNRVAEKITMNFHDVAPDGTSYAFDVTGSVSGNEGSGQSGADFTAKSSRYTIKAGDIALNTVKKVTKKDLPPQFTVEWEMRPMSLDTWKAPAGMKPESDSHETVIRCWTDGPHELQIIPNGDGPVALQSLTIFSPMGWSAQ